MSPAQWTIVVLGDWVVDEYWFLKRHESGMSSHVGPHHYRLSGQHARPFRELSGAGRIAGHLYELRGKTQAYQVVGLGNWSHNDTSLLYAFFRKQSAITMVPPQLLTISHARPPEGLRLEPLKSGLGTSRVVRLYLHDPEGRKQLARLDWPLQDRSSATSPPRSLRERLSGLILPNVAIVVCDLGKSAVTTEVVGELKKLFPKAGWYVATKVGDPNWLRTIERDVRLRLFLRQSLAARTGHERWLLEGRISGACFELLDRKSRHDVVLLSQTRQVMARLNHGATYVVADGLPIRDPRADIGWTSAIFARLVCATHTNGSLEECHLRDAVSYADNKGAGILETRQDSGFAHRLAPRSFRAGDWSTESSARQQAYAEPLGLIEQPPDEARLDVWRSWTDLPHYVACIPEKQQIIREIAQHIRAFASSGRRRNLSMLLTADPGAGKTSLARSLAQAFEFSFIMRDLTQVASREDLLDLFDEIRDKQATDKKDVLVFIDEINAEVGSATSYGAFLAPLEDGTYVRSGRRSKLEPCVWILAGTGPDEASERQSKWKDLESRITYTKRLDYRSLKVRAKKTHSLDRLYDLAKLEQVYLGAAMIEHYCPDVDHISEEVLWRFRALDPEMTPSPARIIRKRVALLTNVGSHIITRENWGQRWEDLEDGEVLPKRLGKRLVKLVFS